VQAESYHVANQNIFGFEVTVTSYRIGESYYCHVASRDPGAVIARAEAATHEEAKKAAIEKAMARLKPKKG
jgi:hypothetical protein